MKRIHWAMSAAVLAVFGNHAMIQGQDGSQDSEAIFKRLDKNSDGKLTASEVPEDQKRFFDRLVRLGDKNSDGELTAEEFAQANKPEERPNVPLGSAGGDQGRGDARARFEMLDRNRDGKVTLDEVPEQFRDRVKPLFDRIGKQEMTLEDFLRAGPRPEPGEMFKRLDANSDGKLTKDELPPEARERFGNLFDRLGKTEVTRDEFQQAMARLAEGGRPGAPGEGRPMGNPDEMFGRLDTNGDGKVSAAEAPERMRPLVEDVLRRAGKEKDGALTKEEFTANFRPMTREGQRRPEGDQPSRESERRTDSAPTRDGERRADADRPREDRVRDERRPESGPPREGDRRPGEGRGPIIMRMLDTNHDGRLSKDELAKINDMFGELDRNQDGQLDLSELLGFVPGEGRPGPRDGDAGPREGGRPRDASGQERRPDNAAAIDRGAFFQRLDKDGDGKISKEEAPEQLKERFSALDTNGDGFISQDEFRAGAQQLGDRQRNRNPEPRPESPKRD